MITKHIKDPTLWKEAKFTLASKNTITIKCPDYLKIYRNIETEELDDYSVLLLKQHLINPFLYNLEHNLSKLQYLRLWEILEEKNDIDSALWQDQYLPMEFPWGGNSFRKLKTCLSFYPNSKKEIEKTLTILKKVEAKRDLDSIFFKDFSTIDNKKEKDIQEVIKLLKKTKSWPRYKEAFISRGKGELQHAIDLLVNIKSNNISIEAKINKAVSIKENTSEYLHFLTNALQIGKTNVKSLKYALEA